MIFSPIKLRLYYYTRKAMEIGRYGHNDGGSAYSMTDTISFL